MKTMLKITLRALALGFILAASVHPAQATIIAQTYVSGAAGSSDNNPCTRLLPCATFTGALAKTSPGGIITAMNAADYGSVDITQSVTIDGTETQASIVTNSPTTPAIAIDGTSTDTIILRHLSITGLSSSGDGVSLNTGNLVMDDCKIVGFANFGLYNNSAGTAVVENTAITGCNICIANYGPGPLSARNVTLQGTNTGLDSRGGPVDISHSLITQNHYYGLYAFISTASVLDCIITGNGTAVFANSNSTIRLTGNDIFNNATGIDTTQGGIVSTAQNNHKAGSTTPGAPTPGKIIVTQ